MKWNTRKLNELKRELTRLCMYEVDEGEALVKEQKATGYAGIIPKITLSHVLHAFMQLDKGYSLNVSDCGLMFEHHTEPEESLVIVGVWRSVVYGVACGLENQEEETLISLYQIFIKKP